MRRKDLFWVVLAGQPYPTLAQNTSFQGDEFSNNLFSDLGKIYNLINGGRQFSGADDVDDTVLCWWLNHCICIQMGLIRMSTVFWNT